MYNFLLIDDYEGEIDSFKDTIEVLNKNVSTHLTTLGIFQASSRGVLVH